MHQVVEESQFKEAAKEVAQRSASNYPLSLRNIDGGSLNSESLSESEEASVSSSSLSIPVSSMDSSSVKRKSSVYLKHVIKVSKLFEDYDVKLMSLNYRLVECKIMFAKLYSKIKSFMLLIKQTV